MRSCASSANWRGLGSGVCCAISLPVAERQGYLGSSQQLIPHAATGGDVMGAALLIGDRGRFVVAEEVVGRGLHVFR